MHLYFIRHAIAVDPGTPGFSDDSLRPLTEKGAKKMVNISRGLRELDVKFDIILSSPYVRARQTAEILADVFKMEDRLAFSRNLTPASTSEQIIAEINEKYDLESIALVGHEPLLSALIGTLLANNDNISINMKKGGVCCLELDDLRHERNATLEWLLTPSQLSRLWE